MRLFSDKLTLVWGLLLVFLSFVYFKLHVSSLLFEFTGSGWSYVIDQGIPILSGVILFLIFFKKTIIISNILSKIRFHLLSLLILISLVFLVHGSLINTFFYAEDVTLDIAPIMQKKPISNIMFGYQLLPTVISAMLFKANVLPYNILTLLLFPLMIILAYWFIYVLSKNKFIALFSCLFFATTPAYLDLFPWHGLAQGLPFVISLDLISLILLVYFQKTGKGIYYILSLIFFMAAINDGFVRTAGMTSIPIFLLWFLNWGKLKSNLYRFFLSLPYFLISFIFFLINFTGTQSSLTSNDGTIPYMGKYLTAISYYVAHLFFPAGLSKYFFPLATSVIEHSFGIFFSVPFSVVALIGFSYIFLLLVITIIKAIRRKSLLSWLFFLGVILIFSNIFYVPIFQSVPTDIISLDNKFSRLYPPHGPGSRYLVPSSLGVGILFAIFLWWIGKKGRYFSILSKILLVSVVSVNGILSFQLHNKFIGGEMKITKMLVENIFSMVPHDGKPKIILSSNNVYKNQIDTNHGGGGWISNFYNIDKLLYTRDMEKFKELIESGKYKKENVYAFYTNPETNAFADISPYYRDNFFSKTKRLENKIDVRFDNNFQQTKITFIEDENVYLSKRPVLISEDINKRVIFAQLLNIDIKISVIEPKFPFLDIVVKRNPKVIPDFIWDNFLETPPLVVNAQSNINGYLLDDLVNKSNLRKSDDYSAQAFWYVDNADIFNQLLATKEYNNLGLVYACAEDDDWRRQNENMSKIIPEVWQTEILPFNNLGEQIALSAPINCHGSVLRKIIIIGPPFPSVMEMGDTSIN